MPTDVIDYRIIGNDLQALVITLDPEEAVVAEAGAMMYMDPDILAFAAPFPGHVVPVELADHGGKNVGEGSVLGTVFDMIGGD